MMQMTIEAGEHVQPATGTTKKPIAVWDLLQWAFRSECAQLDFDEIGSEAGGRVGIGIEYVLMQQSILGCRPDGGGSSAPHHDADIVASALSALPDHVGGRSMAISIAELARAGQVPDWMPDARPKIVPIEVQTNQHGWRSKTVDSAEFGSEGWPRQPRRNRKGVVVHDVVKCCPVEIRPTPDQIGRAHRGYLAWWGALLDLRQVLHQSAMLSRFTVTDAMPPLQPWK
ncbi:hypothetical protein [Pelagimonas varians]|uniref:Uncharacterized protein n=1 Tax=Pelagimonas varians TaxID=696760 RepID=A0A238KEL3_9RHOB|nr:hypothetical protein [Pelagimonas varians]PYG29979.1 hypothetical protein C8N36_107145 [Pelagimonas varians]SMX40582.1 hypothetical protein PEV8663_02050 [Pelagimonas varians]